MRVIYHNYGVEESDLSLSKLLCTPRLIIFVVFMMAITTLRCPLICSTEYRDFSQHHSRKRWRIDLSRDSQTLVRSGLSSVTIVVNSTRNTSANRFTTSTKLTSRASSSISSLPSRCSQSRRPLLHSGAQTSRLHRTSLQSSQPWITANVERICPSPLGIEHT